MLNSDTRRVSDQHRLAYLMDVALQRELLEVAGSGRRGPHRLPHLVDGAPRVAAEGARRVVVVTEHKRLWTVSPVHHGADSGHLDR